MPVDAGLFAQKNSDCPIFGIEIMCEINDNFSPVLKEYWGNAVNNPLKWFKLAQDAALDAGASFVSVYFNSQEPDEAYRDSLLKKYENILDEVQKIAKIPLMLRFSSHSNWDILIANALIPRLKSSSLIAPVQSANYKEIISAAKKTKINHTFVLRTPIDINLTKELNILSIDEGLDKTGILIDPDTGCIGYGIDYGYSIIERICLARKDGDCMLDMPVIVFAGEESYKAKESKSTDFSASWGNLEERALCWEISTASSLICAGANIAVLWHPEAVKTLRKEFCEVLCH